MVPMSDLRAVYESLGFTQVQTYLQSGNVVCRSRRMPSPATVEDAVERRFGFRAAIVLRTSADLHAVIAANPFPDVEPSKSAVILLVEDPGEEARRRLLALPPAPEQVVAIGRELFIYYPNGMGRPKLSMAAVERALRVTGTGRNWNTVRKLSELADQLESAPVPATR